VALYNQKYIKIITYIKKIFAIFISFQKRKIKPPEKWRGEGKRLSSLLPLSLSLTSCSLGRVQRGRREGAGLMSQATIFGLLKSANVPAKLHPFATPLFYSLYCSLLRRSDLSASDLSAQNQSSVRDKSLLLTAGRLSSFPSADFVCSGRFDLRHRTSITPCVRRVLVLDNLEYSPKRRERGYCSCN